MKTLFKKAQSITLMLLMLTLATGYCMATAPHYNANLLTTQVIAIDQSAEVVTPVIPNVNDTWKCDVTTAKTPVVFFASSQTPLRGFDHWVWVTRSSAEIWTDIKQVVKDGVKDTVFNALQTFAFNTGAVKYWDAPDLSAISTGFFEKGPEIMRKRVNNWDLAKSGIKVYKKVKAPIKLPKLSAKGNPRPYDSADHSSGNGFGYTDRELKVNQSKWDFKYDAEQFRNTYLDDNSEKPEYEQGLDQMAKEYLSAINTTMGSGTYNSSGTTAAAIATGFLTIIANEITATNLTATVTGAITSSNAVTKVEIMKTAAPTWMRELPEGEVKILCSFDVFDKYCAHYRSINNVGFLPRATGGYWVDGSNIQLVPVSWLGTSQRLILTVNDNLSCGTDSDGIGVFPSLEFNLIKTRLMMPVGFQIADLGALLVNDQA